VDKLTIGDIFDEGQQQELIRAVVKHNLSTEQLVCIAGVSALLGDRGIKTKSILNYILKEHIHKGYLDIKVNEK